MLYIEELKTAFSYPLNKDFGIREVYIKAIKTNAALVYLKGTINSTIVDTQVLRPLMEEDVQVHLMDDLALLIRALIPVQEITLVTDFQAIKSDILKGNTILLVDGYSGAISIGTVGFEKRSIEKPETERVLKGPKEAFVESSEANRSLIRKQVRDEGLITEFLNVGERAQNTIAIMYIKDLATDELVDKVKNRIKEVQVDTVLNISILEEHIEERSYSLVPSVIFTERPDRAAAFLLEGHVVLLMDNSPLCLIVPVTFWSFFHTPEDHYQRWVYGNFIRMIRLFAICVALFTPSIYIAVTNFHTEMIPLDLLLAVAATRERVPFPVLLEVLLMEISFELLREAGVRIPAPMGPTIGIVGALILGQAAVEANIVSPILVVVVAITGLASFAIPEASINYLVRISRFIFLAFTASFGFFGFTTCVVGFMCYLTTFKSYGLPFFAPLSPHYRSSKDLLIRPPVWKQWFRPFSAKSKENVRKKPPEGSSNQ